MGVPLMVVAVQPRARVQLRSGELAGKPPLTGPLVALGRAGVVASARGVVAPASCNRRAEIRSPRSAEFRWRPRCLTWRLSGS
jgi:hypothetical protein